MSIVEREQQDVVLVHRELLTALGGGSGEGTRSLLAQVGVTPRTDWGGPEARHRPWACRAELTMVTESSASLDLFPNVRRARSGNGYRACDRCS